MSLWPQTQQCLGFDRSVSTPYIQHVGTLLYGSLWKTCLQSLDWLSKDSGNKTLIWYIYCSPCTFKRSYIMVGLFVYLVCLWSLGGPTSFIDPLHCSVCTVPCQLKGHWPEPNYNLHIVLHNSQGQVAFPCFSLRWCIIPSWCQTWYADIHLCRGSCPFKSHWLP